MFLHVSAGCVFARADGTLTGPGKGTSAASNKVEHNKKSFLLDWKIPSEKAFFLLR